MNRRNFLKALGYGSSVTALGACGIDDNRYYTPIEQILPYVVRPEQVTPGTPTFFATTVLSGPDAYPQLARHRDGRVINVGANPAAPADPAVPLQATLEVQRHFNPDRHRGPSQQGAPVSWDQGLQRLGGAVAAARNSGKQVAWLGPYRSGAIAELLQEFTGGNAIFWEPLGRDAEAKAAEALFGDPTLPSYDIANARYILSFGAEFLGGGWGGAWSQAAYARARNPNVDQAIARFALVSPHRGQAGANADDWVAVVPGSEAQVALAVARLVAEKRNYSGPARALVAAGDPDRAAAAAGVDVAEIRAIADLFAASPAVALPGGLAGASAAATELAAAVYLLNIVSGHDLFHEGGYRAPVHGFDRVEALVAAMQAGQVGVLLVDDTNPVHTLPRELGFADALAKVDLSVGLSSHPSETSALVNLLLPTSDAFEDWGDEEPRRGVHLLRQPAQSPMWDTRSLGDVLLASWRAADPAAPSVSWRDYVIQRWSQRLYGTQGFWDEVGGFDAQVPLERLTPYMGAPADVSDEAPADEPADGVQAQPDAQSQAFQRWWQSRLAAGFYLHPSALAKVTPEVTGTIRFSDAPSMAGSGTFNLVTYSHPHLVDGRYANQPWAQEVPEPLTGIVWDSFVLVHPDTARQLGVRDNSLVTLTTEKGSIQVGVEVQPLVRPDTVAVAFGQGHTAAGRYADGTGKNVVDLLAVVKDAFGALAWQQQRVGVQAAGGNADLVSTYGHDTDNDRAFAVSAGAAKLAAVGDRKDPHPGELTGIHHLPLDERLQKAGVAGFYPIPEHPVYRFGMTVDTNACTGCGACEVACYAENNLAVVGKHKVAQKRQMSWIRVNRYYEDGGIHFVPMMCQQCGHAPCESVCPVLATYHSIDGLNAMVYNRCVGTRYCSNACPYSVRKFNYHTYAWPEPFNLQLNPDVVTRTMGVMEKCTFCVQRIRDVKSAYRDRGFTRTVPEEALTQLPACVEACPSQALQFGNLNNAESVVSRTRESARNYYPLAELNTYPAINYLAKASFHYDPTAGHGGGHGGDAHHDEEAH